MDAWKNTGRDVCDAEKVSVKDAACVCCGKPVTFKQAAKDELPLMVHPEPADTRLCLLTRLRELGLQGICGNVPLDFSKIILNSIALERWENAHPGTEDLLMKGLTGKDKKDIPPVYWDILDNYKEQILRFVDVASCPQIVPYLQFMLFGACKRSPQNGNAHLVMYVGRGQQKIAGLAIPFPEKIVVSYADSRKPFGYNTIEYSIPKTQADSRHMVAGANVSDAYARKKACSKNYRPFQ